MATYIYARCSTDRQDTANQLHELQERYPDATVIEETASGAKARPALDALLARLRTGDTLVVYALDRLGRSCGELVLLLDDLLRREVQLVSLREGIDLGTIAGRFTAQIFAAMAEMERSILSERVKTALKAKKAAGVKLGAPTKVTADVKDRLYRLKASGRSRRSAARELGLSPTTVCKHW